VHTLQISGFIFVVLQFVNASFTAEHNALKKFGVTLCKVLYRCRGSDSYSPEEFTSRLTCFIAQAGRKCIERWR